MENMEENSDKIWTIWKKSKFNSEKIWKIRKISVLVIITPKESSFSSLRPLTPAAAAVAAAIHTYPRGAATAAATAAAATTIAAAASAIPLKFHPEHVTNKNKTKHIMKISHINVNIYGNYGRKVSWILIVKRYGKYRRKASRIVKRFGKYRRRLWKDM